MTKESKELLKELIDQISIDQHPWTLGVIKCECGYGQLTSGKYNSNTKKLSRYVSGHNLPGGLVTHNMSKTNIYGTYLRMKDRCINKTNQDYPHYGGRGIRVCERWLNSFENFLEDMGNKPASNYSIDRIDNNGNYEPCNCRWATQKEQVNNTRRCHKITFNGKTMNLTQWADELGILRSTLVSRIIILNWPIELALTKKKRINQYV